mmetsp:Transcript_41571/g.115665  ORF Transcript_41571/g.115665 Transcript_41571/m.115665 type:complete len:277 (-) Transcript_41571:41-871(-)
MALRVATSHVRVPAKGARLHKLLCGVTPSKPHLPLMQRCAKQMTLQALGAMGLSRDYFHSDFLSGARTVLGHLSDGILPRMQWESASFNGFKGAEVLERSLQGFWLDALRSLEVEGLELRWELEAITEASLSELHMVCGHRRSMCPAQAAANEDAFRAAYAGHTVVLRGKRRLATARDCLSAVTAAGATLSADVLLTARQTVALQRRGSEGEVVAAQFDEAAQHVLRLEAEIECTPSPYGKGLGMLQIDETRGWVVSDLNVGLDGNCAAMDLPRHE